MSELMKRREFVTLLGGAAAAWPFVARAQQPERIRRVGVLMGIAANDPGARGRIASIEKPLQDLGWVFGRNIEVHYRWGAGDTDLTRAYAKELFRDAARRHLRAHQHGDGCAAP